MDLSPKYKKGQTVKIIAVGKTGISVHSGKIVTVNLDDTVNVYTYEIDLFGDGIQLENGKNIKHVWRAEREII